MIAHINIRAMGYRLGLCVLLAGLAIMGCGSPVHQSAPVDAGKARGVLETALDSWKGGEKPTDLEEHQPPITVQDFDWMGGAKLVAYEIEGDGKAVDANLVANVKLTLEDSKGNKSDKTVTYHVGTAPTLTVFRDSSL